MKEEKNSMEKMDSIINARREDISDKNVKDYIQLLFLRNTLLAERTASNIKDLLAQTDIATSERFRGILADIQLLKDGMIALQLLAKDIGLIKMGQVEISRDIKGLRKDLGYNEEVK
jgi:hypothetical protein